MFYKRTNHNVPSLLGAAQYSDTQDKPPRYGAELRNAPRGEAWLRDRPKASRAFGFVGAREAQLRRWVRDGVQLRHEACQSLSRLPIDQLIH